MGRIANILGMRLTLRTRKVESPIARAPVRCQIDGSLDVDTERSFRGPTAAAIAAQRGSSLLESVLGVGLLGVIGVVFLAAIGTSLSSAGIVGEIYTASNLAQTQMEDIKSQPYSDTNSYGVTVSPTGDYAVSIAVVDESPALFPNTLQRVIVDVSHGGERVLRLESYKAKL